MDITPEQINKEGFSILHGKWGGSRKFHTLIGVGGKREGSGPQVGYLAYPNVGLKNIIPSSRFYYYDELLSVDKLPVADQKFKTSGSLQQSVTEEQYIQKIEEIKELLAAGEIYQMCYSIRFRKKFSGNPYALFLKLSKSNPVDFQAYLNCGKFQIISSSPERFFKVSDGKITTTPIKGTISKKKEENLQYLLSSEKEQAELDMITDLERNDVGKICEYGTLKLKKEREILELKNLWHTYSEVEGKLQSDVGYQEIIDAMFPGGSITGCPKRRAMKYISQLEGLPRNIFTGSIGYISMSNDQLANSQLEMDFNIAIRTILIKDGYLEFWAGGGIVVDSEPEKEYKECLLKAEKFLGII
ncbi:anthranilate synthase component I family protein [candidate division KSB1 bacterium]